MGLRRYPSRPLSRVALGSLARALGRSARALAPATLAALTALGVATVAPPAWAQPKPKPGAPKKPDMEVDPDAKPPEEKPLPPADPNQWGTGGKDDEGKFAPGGEKKEKADEAKAKAKVEVKVEEPKADLGPDRLVSLDWVSGFGSIHDITNARAAGNGGKTAVTSMSFLVSFSWRFADIWTVGARFPFSQANITGPMGTTDVAQTVAPGNLELYVRPSFELRPHLRLPAELALYFPSAQGDLFGDISSDHVAPFQALVNQAASASRGWEDMALFAPHRFGIRAAAGINYDTTSIHFAGGTGFDVMARVGGNDPGMGNGGGTTGLVRNPAFAWVTKASFFYSFAVGPGFIEPGLRAWLVYAQLPWYTQSTDDSGAQFVLEPAVNARYAVNEAKSLWVNGRLGFIAPVAGPIGSSPVVGASIKGFRVDAEFQF